MNNILDIIKRTSDNRKLVSKCINKVDKCDDYYQYLSSMYLNEQ